MALHFGPRKPSTAAPQPPPRGGPPVPVSGTIGRFRLVEQIGVGAFGSVFKAVDPTTGGFVALKTCHVGEDGHARFAREARLASALQHPNITRVYETGMHEGTPYMVQELLGGRDLSALILERQPYGLDEKRRILVDVANGLDYGHQSGVIHRDIKPTNIRVLPDGSARIMDYGIAKTVSSQTGMTRAGMSVGTAGYMSPEQVLGQPIGPQTDIFLLGATAYELLSFQAPFRHQNMFRLMEMILEEEPDPLIDVAPTVPPEIAAVVAKAMRKVPDERFASAAEFRDAIAPAGRA
jgi:eukaryotic-like serine/threonine-protein kinase